MTDYNREPTFTLECGEPTDANVRPVEALVGRDRPDDSGRAGRPDSRAVPPPAANGPLLAAPSPPFPLRGEGAEGSTPPRSSVERVAELRRLHDEKATKNHLVRQAYSTKTKMKLLQNEDSYTQRCHNCRCVVINISRQTTLRLQQLGA